MKNYLVMSFMLCMIAAANQVQSQSIQSISQGFSVHAHGSFARWNSNSHFLSGISGEDPSGIGFGVELQYGFSSMISGYLAFENVNFNSNDEWEDYNTNLYRFGGLYNFGGTTSRIRPFLYAGGVYQNFKLARIFIDNMGTQVVDDGELASKGFALEVGGGLKFHIIPEFVLKLSLSGQFGQYGSNFVNGKDYDFEETVDTQHLFVRLGIGYYLY